MNFLSHLYLSGNDEGLLIGNFIADGVKGKAFLNYPEAIQKGILLHRKIDSYTDSHPIVELSKIRLRPKYKKYAPVIVDVYYDHFLAANWKNYSSESLHDYTQKIYDLMKRNYSLLPEKTAHFCDYMIHYNILEAYSEIRGIKKVLQGMAGRASFQSHMELSIADLEEHYELFGKEFKDFFPELISYVKEEITRL